MIAYRRPFALVALTVALLAAACGSSSTASGSTAVSVSGVDYSQDALRADLADMIVDGTAPAADTTQWINEWIFFTAIGLELESRGVVPTAAQVESATTELQTNDPEFDPTGPGSGVLIDQWALRVAALDWVAAEFPYGPDPEPDPDAPPPNMLCSKHILVATEQEALDVLDRLDAGEDFGALATELSLDTGSGAAGGDLGCYVEGTLVPEFEAAGYAAEDGEIVGPVQSQFGFHVIEVLSAGPATAEEHPNADPADIEAAVAAGAELATSAAHADVDAQRDALLGDVQDGAVANYADSVTVASEYGEWDPEQFLLVGPGDPAATG